MVIHQLKIMWPSWWHFATNVFMKYETPLKLQECWFDPLSRLVFQIYCGIQLGSLLFLHLNFFKIHFLPYTLQLKVLLILCRFRPLVVFSFFQIYYIALPDAASIVLAYDAHNNKIFGISYFWNWNNNMKKEFFISRTCKLNIFLKNVQPICRAIYHNLT